MQALVGESLPPWSSCPELQLILFSGPTDILAVCGEGRKGMLLLLLLSSFLPLKLILYEPEMGGG